MLVYTCLLMYTIVSFTLIVAAVAWHLEMLDLWFSSLGVTIGVATIVNVRDVYTQTKLRDSLNAMVKTECCCTDRCQDPKSVLVSTCVLRCCTGLLAVLAVFISWLEHEAFNRKEYTLISVSWGVVSVVWLLSCVPLFISLVQCAAHIAGLDMDGKIDKILWYRKTVAMWLVHDIVLGLFWLYMASMLYDIADDQDDTEWRTIFLSMVSWHIVVLMLDTFSVSPTIQTLREDNSKSIACFAKERAQFWWKVIHIISLISLYAVLITRMRHGDLRKMGSTFAQLVAFICCAIFVGVSKDMQLKDVFIKRKPRVKSRPTSRIELETGLSF